MLFSYKRYYYLIIERSIFIYSNRIPPKEIQIYKRAQSRFPVNHPYLKGFLTKRKIIEAGYFGECYVDHFLHQMTFPKNHYIFKGLHLQIEPETFLQIDTLIVTQKYIAILEIKNIKGKVHFQKHPKQLIRDFHGEIATYKCPEQQILRHSNKIRRLLTQLNIKLLIENRIVFAFSSTHIAEPPEKVIALMACDITNHLDELNQLPDAISSRTFKRLIDALTSIECEYFPKPFAETFQFDWKTLNTGLFCPNCEIKLIHPNRCPLCKTSRKTLYTLAIEEWFYLCKNTISNNECVHFLNLKDKYAATYLLKNLQLESHNHNKYRRYAYSKSFWLTKESITPYKYISRRPEV